MNRVSIFNSDSLKLLKRIPDQYIDCCVTSPPYWGLRNYGVDGQYGLEKTPEEYVSKMVEVFREMRRVLKNNGTFFLNLGDSYCGGAAKTSEGNKQRRGGEWLNNNELASLKNNIGLKPKNLIGIPWLVAFALQKNDWILRNEIIWWKRNAMCQSVKDRFTVDFEKIFFFVKSKKYFFEQQFEPYKDESIARKLRGSSTKNKRNINENKSINCYQGGLDKPRENITKYVGTNMGGSGKTFIGHSGYYRADGTLIYNPKGRNKRCVWDIPVKSFRGAHFATFSEDLIKPMILAGCPENGIVLDPFGGSGTTGIASLKLKRNCILIDLNKEYCDMAYNRLKYVFGRFAKINKKY